MFFPCVVCYEHLPSFQDGAQLTVTNSGMHTVTSSQPVGVEVYGFGEADAYGYFGGIVK
jgi:hypothetical protein